MLMLALRAALATHLLSLRACLTDQARTTVDRIMKTVFQQRLEAHLAVQAIFFIMGGLLGADQVVYPALDTCRAGAASR